MNKQYRTAIKACRRLVVMMRQEPKAVLNNNTIQLFSTLQHVVRGLLVYTELLTSGTRRVTLTQINRLRPLLVAFTQLKKYVEAKKYLQAIKTIREIENKLLPASRLRAQAGVINALLQLKWDIKSASLSTMKIFMAKANKRTALFGSEYELYDKENVVNLTPLISCWKLHKLLLQGDNFKRFYMRQRQLQLKSLLVIPVPASNSLMSYKTYLYSVLGFFVIEHQTWKEIEDLVPTGWLVHLFKSTLWELQCTLDETLPPAHCMQLNLTANRRYKYYDLIKGPLLGPLQFMVVLFHLVLTTRCSKMFKKFLKNAHNMNLPAVNSYDDLNTPLSFLETRPVEDGDGGQDMPAQSRRPVYYFRFIHSSMVPAIQVEVESVILDFVRYSRPFFSVSQKISSVQMIVSTLMEEKLRLYLTDFVKDPSLPIGLLWQIAIDSDYLEDVTTHLFSMAKNYAEREYMGHTNFGNVYRTVRDDIHFRLCEFVDVKIDASFPEVDMYNWMLPQTESHTGVSPSIVNIVDWLSSFPNILCQILSHLAYPKIAQKMQKMIQHSAPEGIPDPIVEQIKCDIIKFEQFATERSWQELHRHFGLLKELLNSDEWKLYNQVSLMSMAVINESQAILSLLEMANRMDSNI